MNKQTKILLSILGVVVVGAIVLASANSGLFQGSIRVPGKATTGRVDVSVSATSPSGSRSVSVFDSIAKFTLCGNSNASVGQIGFDLASNDSLNPDALLNSKNPSNAFAVKTKLGVDPVGVYKVTSSNSGSISLVYTMDSSVEIKQGECRDVEVFADTSALVNAKAGVDDFLTVTLSKLYTSSGGNVPSNAPVIANVLKF